jgi:hypothetical protein
VNWTDNGAYPDVTFEVNDVTGAEDRTVIYPLLEIVSLPTELVTVSVTV